MAAAIDRDETALHQALDGMARAGLLALKRPEAYGGPAMDEASFREFQMECARASGAFAFLQTQHQSAVGMIAGGENEALKQAYLPHMHDGGKLVGIGFSQLRRPGPPMLRAERAEGGYRLDGTVPWITGAGYFPEFLIGAQLPDGQAVFGVAPLRNEEGVEISDPMRLAAMETARTVSAEFDGFILKDEQVAFLKPTGWIANNDEINIALQGAFAMGCAQAGIDVVRAAAEKRGTAFLCDAADALTAEWEKCHMLADELRPERGLDTHERRLKLRAWQIDLCARCAHAAVAASSGAANSIDHPAQRIWRESLVYTVSAQTAEIMRATLDRLVARDVF